MSRRVPAGCQHRERRGPPARRVVDPGVVGSGGEVPDDQRAEGVGCSGIGWVRYGGVVPRQGHLVTGVGPCEPGLVDRSVPLQRRVTGGTRSSGHDRAESGADGDCGQEDHGLGHELTLDSHDFPRHPLNRPVSVHTGARRSCHRERLLVLERTLTVENGLLGAPVLAAQALCRAATCVTTRGR